MGIVSAASTNLETLREADVVILCTPMRTLVRQIPLVLPHLSPRAVLTDVGSTKKVFFDAIRRLRPRAFVVGGHPMAGNERQGLDGCDPDLFECRPWILIPSGALPQRARNLLVRLVRGVGSLPLWMNDPSAHDLAVARVSHIPYLLAYALAEQPRDALRVAGNSWRDATRVALSDENMVLDFLLTNRGPIRRSVREIQGRLRKLALEIDRADEKALRKRISRARSCRARIK
jgi:prephenate dehydrogenase